MLYLFTTVRKKDLDMRSIFFFAYSLFIFFFFLLYMTWVFKKDGGKWQIGFCQKCSLHLEVFMRPYSPDDLGTTHPPISFGHCNGNLSKREIENLPPIQPHGHSSLSNMHAFQLAFQPYASLQIYGVTSLSWLQWEVKSKVAKCRGGEL